jgi:hypothetical protein
VGPRPELDDFLPYQFSFRRQITGLLYLGALVLGLAGFILGASFVGAEWSSGGMTNLLLWRPRRDAVLAAKLAVVGAGVLALSVVFLSVWIGAFWLLGAVIGSVGGVSAGSVASAALLSLRITALTLFLALAGATLATIGRRTAAAMGAAMAYLLVFEVGTFIVFGLLRSGFSWRLRFSSYAAALIIKRVELPDAGTGQPYTVTWAGALVVLAVVGAALTAAAFAVLRSRDVT